MSISAAELLRPGLLADRRTTVAPASEDVVSAFADLDAQVDVVAVGDPDSVAAAVAALPPARVLVVDLRAILDEVREAEPAADGGDVLRATLDRAWTVVHAVANAALVPARAGTVILVAPSPSGFVHAPAIRAGVENLARTLGTEWSQYGVSAVALLPGDETPGSVVAALAAYVASPAGDYLSGCALTLDAASSPVGTS
jgi:NAD(P)-dependent dehydrogenase (short-subunit alcohol dehydrogenase family)